MHVLKSIHYDYDKQLYTSKAMNHWVFYGMINIVTRLMFTRINLITSGTEKTTLNYSRISSKKGQPWLVSNCSTFHAGVILCQRQVRRVVLKVYLKYVRKSYQIPGIHIARAAIQITLPPCMHSTFPVFSYLNFHEIYSLAYWFSISINKPYSHFNLKFFFFKNPL